MFGHDTNMSVSLSYPVACSGDMDCDCAPYLSKEMKNCSCIQGECFAIVGGAGE